MASTDDILNQYSAKLEHSINNFNSKNPGESTSASYSQSYQEFRKSLSPEFSRYERWCKTLGGAFKLKLGKKDSEKIGKNIEIAHLNVMPSEAVSYTHLTLPTI